MQAYICTVCGYVYDEQSADKNIEDELVPFEELDIEWVCPICGVSPDLFEYTDSEHIPDVPIEK